jgi:VWFA-related protein
MQFKEVARARMAIRKYVNDQMQPGDLVAILPTSGGNASFLMFTAEKQHLLTLVDNIKWYPDTRVTSSMPQYPAIRFAIQALRDMPGRKSLILISNQTFLGNVPAFLGMIDQIADQALRAGVVIHTLDIRGLMTFPETPIGDFIDLNDATEAAGLAIETSQKQIPLSSKTGGLFLAENNFFVNGIGDLDEEMKGYYLLSYKPPANTFKSDNSPVYHKVKISVKRPGSEVHTREGFYGEPGTLKTPDKNSNPMVEAMNSPFRYNDLKVDLASGYIDDPEKGYLLRA